MPDSTRKAQRRVVLAALVLAILTVAAISGTSAPSTQSRPFAPVSLVQRAPLGSKPALIEARPKLALFAKARRHWFAVAKANHMRTAWYQKAHERDIAKALSSPPVTTAPQIVIGVAVQATAPPVATSPAMCAWEDRDCWHHVFQTVGSINGMPCGGNLPSCCTLRFESGGNPVAQNPRSTASGLWQDLDTTWANAWLKLAPTGYGGLSAQQILAKWPRAWMAPASYQNYVNGVVFAGGRGASNWYGDGCYTGG